VGKELAEGVAGLQIIKQALTLILLTWRKW
jgi:hypothetical protein